MTNRELLRGRAIRFYRWPIAPVLLLGAFYGRHSVVLSGLTVIAIAAYLAVFIIYMRKTPCLQCGSRMGTASLNWGSRRQPAPCCQHCGVSIDA